MSNGIKHFNQNSTLGYIRRILIEIFFCKGLKKPLISVVLFFLSVGFMSAYGQRQEWSNSRKLKGTAVFTKVLGENGNGVFLMRYRNRFFTRSVIVEKYRNHLGFSFSRNISLRKSRLVSLELNEEGLLFFTAGYNKSTLQNELTAQYYDFNVLPKTKPKVISTALLSEGYDRGDFRVQASSDLQRYAVSYTEKSIKGNRILHFKMIDDQLQVLKSNAFEIPVKYEDFVSIDFQADHQGRVYLLMKEKSKTSRKGERTWEPWRLFCWNSVSDRFSDFSLNDSGVYLQKAKISIDRQREEVLVSAFYSNIGPDGFSGIYLFRLFNHPSHTPIRTFSKFSKDIMVDLIGERPEEDESEAYEFEQLKAVPMSHGGITIVSERASMSSEEDVIYVNGIPQNTSLNIYNFDEVFVLSLDSSGRIVWHKMINKSQSSLNDGGYYSSVIVGVTQDNIHIIFNDKMRGNGNVMQYSINGKGVMSDVILLRSDREYLAVIPAESKQISSNKLLIPVSRDKKFALLKLIY